MSNSDKRFLTAVAADLDLLRTELNKPIDETKLRSWTAVLRRLLLDGSYSRAWRAMGLPKQPRVRAPNLNKLVGAADLADIVYMQTAGATSHGGTIMGPKQFKLERWEDRFKEFGTSNDPEQCAELFSLDNFCNSPCFVVAGKWVSRGQLVQYVAYRLYGIHDGPPRRVDVKVEEAYDALDRLENDNPRIKLLEHTPVYLELLSIGQCLVNSKDTKVFLRRCREAGLLAARND